MAKYKVMMTDTCFPDTSIEKETLAQYDAELVLAPSTDAKDLIETGKDCDGIIFDFADMTEDVLSSLPKCKVCSRVGIGVNNIDIPAASRNGIMVANVPDYCFDEVADHTVALYLALNRRINQYDRMTRSGSWDVTAAGKIYRMVGKKFCLYGLGNIAQRTARRLAPFGFKLYAYDPWIKDDVFEELGVTRVETKEELFEIADALSMHMPLVPETEGVVNMDLLSRMKPTALFVNTARGGVVNEPDLIEALKKGMIAGAGLDVVSEEPLPEDSELNKMENVIITPHVAFYTVEAEEELRKRSALEVMYALTEGEPHSFLNRRDFNKGDIASGE